MTQSNVCGVEGREGGREKQRMNIKSLTEIKCFVKWYITMCDLL